MKKLCWTAALFASALAISGCSIPITDLHDTGMPKAADGYLPGHDRPSGRNTVVVNAAEQAKIRAELRAAVDREATTTAPAVR